MIAHVCTALDWGGTEGNAVTLALGYARRGIDTMMIVDHGPLHRMPVLKEMGIPVEVLGAEENWSSKRYKEALSNVLQGMNASLIHSNGWERKGEIFEVAKRLKIPVVSTKHSTVQASWRHRLGITRHPLIYWKDVLLYARTNPIVINISDLSERNFRRLFPTVTRTRRVYLGAPVPDQAVDASHNGNAPQVVWVASLIERKRPLEALRVWREVTSRFPKAHLTMLGDGPLRPIVEKEAALIPNNSVTIAGSTRDVSSYLEKSQILLHTGLKEGIPTVFFEAMNMGIPVVSTNSGAASECVLEGKTGFLVEANNSARMTHCLCTLIDDPQLRLKMGLAGRARGTALFELERHIEETLQTYEELGGISIVRNQISQAETLI